MMAQAALAAAALMGAGPRIEMELAAGDRFSPLESQRWYRLLTELGVAQLQIRGARADDRIEIEVGGAPGQRVYRVRGALSDRGELHVPGGRFSPRDRQALADWLDRLRNEGPPPPGGKRPPFGLSDAEMARVKQVLSRENQAATKGLVRGDALEQLDAQLDGIPLALDKSIARQTPRGGQGDEVADELKGLALGTALAAVLRPEGLALQPRRTPQETLELVIVDGRGDVEGWPIGWACEPRQKLPKLYTMLNAELADVSLERALGAIAGRLQTPILLDHNGLAEARLDLRTLQAAQPAQRTSYSVLLRKLLVPQRLKFEVRADDAGKAFLWITPTGLR